MLLIDVSVIIIFTFALPCLRAISVPVFDFSFYTPSRNLSFSVSVLVIDVSVIITGRAFTSGFSSRLASYKRQSRENSCFCNSFKVKRVGKLQWNSH